MVINISLTGESLACQAETFPRLKYLDDAENSVKLIRKTKLTQEQQEIRNQRDKKKSSACFYGLRKEISTTMDMVCSSGLFVIVFHGVTQYVTMKVKVILVDFVLQFAICSVSTELG